MMSYSAVNSVNMLDNHAAAEDHVNAADTQPPHTPTHLHLKLLIHTFQIYE